MPIYIIDRKFSEIPGESLQPAAEGVLSMVETVPPKSAKKPHWTSLEIGLLTIVSLLFIVILALIVLFATQRTDSDGVCTTADCTQAASRLIENMDANVDPCDNFYQYACGGWLKKNIIPETSSRYSTFDILQDELEVVLKDVLEKSVEGEASALTKAKTLYRSCTNESQIEKRGGAPLLDMLPNVFEWPIATDHWESVYGDTWKLEDAIARLNEKYGTHVLVNFFIGTDDKDSNSHIIHVGGRHMHRETPILRHMRRETPILRHVRRETPILRHVRRETPILRHVRRETPILRHVRRETPILRHVRRETPILRHVRRETPILRHVRPLTLLGRDLVYLFAQTTKSFVYLKSNSVRYSHTKLSEPPTLAVRALIGHTTSVFTETHTDPSACIYQALLFRFMEEMISVIREVFISNLDHLRWMDVETKKAAEEKAQAIRERIGYSNNIKNDTYLNNEYRNLSYSAEEYFQNILQNLNYVQKKRLRKLRVKVNKEEWVTGAAIVNAFYSSSKNQIVFPAGILQPPFFGKGQTKSLNFGGIGMVIGHEITHGFDDNGRNYDKDGDLKEWWTPSSTQNFVNLSKCIVDQYGSFSWDLANGMHVCCPLLSLFSASVFSSLSQEMCTGFTSNWDGCHALSHSCLFLQVWCGTHRPQQAVNSIKVDVHSPGKFRVLGSLQNFPEFAKAFNCPKNSYMVPDSICRVW
nr:neprilysin-like [Oncorhynchus nerka]